MNLTELSAELESRAAEVTPSIAMARLAAVRGRVRARRRRQAGAVALVAAMCAIGIAVVPSIIDEPSHRSAPPAKSDKHLSKPFTFDDKFAGDPLVTAAVGKPGQNVVILKVTLPDTNIFVSAFCYVANPRTSLWEALTIRGHSNFEGGCDTSSVANGESSSFSGVAAVNRGGWAGLGLVPGKESVFRVQLQTEKGKIQTDPTVRLGVAIYAQTGDRVTSDGVVIKRDAEQHGHDYRLVQYRTEPATRTARPLFLHVPAGRWPVLVTAGITTVDGLMDSKDEHRASRLLIDGGVKAEMDGGITGGEALDDAHAHTIELPPAGFTSGVLLLAYYERVD